MENGAEIRGADISLEALKTSTTPLLPIQLLSVQHKKASISVTGATIEGSDVAITANAEDANLLDDPAFNIVNNLVSQPLLRVSLLDFFGALGVPPILSAVSVQKRAADAAITVTGSQIYSSGDVNIHSTVDVSSAGSASGAADSTKKGSVKPLEFVPFSAGYSRADGRANTVIDGVSQIVADGSVDITSDATTSATVSAFTASNAFTTKSTKPYQPPTQKQQKKIDRSTANGKTTVPAIAIAITDTDTTSKALIGSNVSIRARGNVTVDAKGDVTNQARSAAIVYADGTGSVGFAMGSDVTNIVSQVDGHIEAGGISAIKQLKLSQVDEQLNTLRIPNHGLVDGEIFKYRAATPTAPNQSLAPIGGLEDGATYRVIVIDSDTIQLAQSSSIELDASGIRAGAVNSLSRRAAKSVSNLNVDLATNIITLAGHGFSELQTVDIITTQDWTLTGLAPQGEYSVHVIDADRIQLLTRLPENAGSQPQGLPGTDRSEERRVGKECA